jgi:hypothetical protein
MPKKKEWQVVHTSWEIFDAAAVADGWLLPGRLTARSEGDGKSVRIEIEVSGGKARAKEVTVSSDRPHGVGWSVLATLPVRNIVATACLDALRRAEPGDEGTLHLSAPRKQDADEVRRIVQGLVGYRPKATR